MQRTATADSLGKHCWFVLQARWGEEVESGATPVSDVLWLELKPSPPSSTPSTTASKQGVRLEKLAGLSSLKVLCLSGLSMRELPLPFDTLVPELRRLELKGCAKLEHLPPCIGDLTKLEYLVCSGASSLQDLPPEVCSVSSLRVLAITDAGKLTQLPGELGSLTNLELLMVQGTSITQLPETLVNLEKLELLDLYGSRQLKRLPESLDTLGSLKVLDLQDCALLTSLPNSLGDVSTLQALYLTGEVKHQHKHTKAEGPAG